MKKYIFDIVNAEDGTDDVVLQLTDEFCKEEDWRPGDIIQWDDNKDGSYTLINKSREERQ